MYLQNAKTKKKKTYFNPTRSDLFQIYSKHIWARPYIDEGCKISSSFCKSNAVCSLEKKKKK